MVNNCRNASKCPFVPETIDGPCIAALNCPLWENVKQHDENFHSVNETREPKNTFSETYNKIRDKAERLPQFLKDSYNRNFAISKHSRKLN